ncbi:hypothetical protein AVEN_58934-1 [Araneus ventricosus]|uniref:Uncharacterized protein n=1 Tax=Araneus ventricosus TaxID=182803 RepID=A0A4Y2EPF8_ARAVE|nr:hypothetical protein AVEN_58934-1 [Araneus ventricosus]
MTIRLLKVVTSYWLVKIFLPLTGDSQCLDLASVRLSGCVLCWRSKRDKNMSKGQELVPKNLAANNTVPSCCRVPNPSPMEKYPLCLFALFKIV